MKIAKVKSTHVLNDDEISLKELISKANRLLRYVFSKRIWILLFSVCGGGLGFIYAVYKKADYTATTTFVLESSGSGNGLSQYAGIASMVGLDISGDGGGLFQGDNILELYKSRTMIERTLLSPIGPDSSMTLLDKYVDFNRLKDNWSQKPELSKIKFFPKDVDGNSISIRTRDSILGKIVEDIGSHYLSVSKPDKKLSIIKVSVTAQDEIFAKCFNDELVKNVNDFYIRTKTKKSLANVQILQRKVDSVKAVMNGAIYSAAIVSDQTPNLNPTRQIQRVVPSQRSQFVAESNKAVLMELIKNLELNRMSLLKETPLIQVVDQPIYPLHINKLGKVKATIVAAMAFGFLAFVFFIIKRILKNITA